MDPLTVSLAIALATGISTVVGKLIDKGVDAALEPSIEQIKSRIQSKYRDAERQQKLVGAFDAALDDASKASRATDTQKYQLRIALLKIVRKGNESLRDQVMGLVVLADNPDDETLIPDGLLHDLGLAPQQKVYLARALYFLRQRLYPLDELHQLFDIAHQQSVRTALRSIQNDLSALTRVIENDTLRVRVVESAWNPTLYFESLLVKYGRLPLRLLGTRQLKSDKPITLDEVYTDLDVLGTVESDQVAGISERTRDVPTAQEWEKTARGERQRLTSLEALSFDGQSRIVLLGYPGSGKSSFVSFLGYCLVKEQLQPGVADGVARLAGWTQGARVPVRVVLRELIAWADETKPSPASTQTLWDYIAFEMKQHGFEDDLKPLKGHLQAYGGLILLDGLDEVREVDHRRDFIKTVIESFADDNARCRFIVTCRPYAYEKPEWQLARFRPYTLAPFNPAQVENFIRVWYQIVGAREDWLEERIEKETTDLVLQTQRRDLQEFAKKPLLLTMMARLHAIDGRLPEDRAKLHERTVSLLLDEWQNEKGRRLERAGAQDGRGRASDEPRRV